MKKLLVFLVVVTLGLAGVAYWISHKGPTNGEDLFTFTSVEYGSLAEKVGGSGALMPRDPLPIVSNIGGQVIEINADFNQFVEEGQVLIRLDPRLAEQKLEQAKQAVELAQANVELAKATRKSAEEHVEQLSKSTLAMQNLLIQARLELAKATIAITVAELKVEEAKQALRQAELGLKLTIIRVPVIDGEKIDLDTPSRPEKRKYLVLDRKVTLNQIVGPQLEKPLFTLVSDLGELQLHAQVTEGDIGRVRLGQDVEFTVSAYSEGDVRFRGKVREVRMVPTNQMGAVFYTVIIDVPNESDSAAPGGWLLRPGMTASVDIIRRIHHNVWKMPTSAISFWPEGPYLTEAAKEKLARWQDRPDWKAVWVLGPDQKPWPIFVRIEGKNDKNESAIHDAEYYEVLEWDPELSPRPDPADPATYPRVIIAAPPIPRSGLLGNLNIKF